MPSGPSRHLMEHQAQSAADLAKSVNPAVSKAAFALKPGAVSDPVQSPLPFEAT